MTFTPSPPGNSGRAMEVLLAFFKLGLTSFGGPVAHLGYFRAEFVQRRHWLDDQAYSDLVALCQFLPGPASSQVGMALGMQRAGWAGLLAAWVGFTLPSALALILFAYGVSAVPGSAAAGWLHGLKIAAVAIVAQAVGGMGRSLCPDPARLGIALGTCGLALAMPGTAGQLAALFLAGLLGRWWVGLPAVSSAGEAVHGQALSRRTAGVALGLFGLLLLALPALAAVSGSPVVALIDGVYRAGALVFGGGHVVLPLLQSAVVAPGYLDDASFMAGYGAAQAVPGPLFSFAAYVGVVARGPLHGWGGAFVLLIALFLPGMLLLVGALPFWARWRRHGPARRILAGINAGVVGILLAALYDPVWTSAIRGWADVAVAAAAVVLLMGLRWPPLWVVALAGAAGWALGN